MPQTEFPEVDLFVNTNGVTIFCPYLTTPRFIPFDTKGRCSMCKSDNVEIDYVLQQQGITIYCSRFKHEKFLNFDVPARFHDLSIIRIRSRGRVYNVPASRLDMYTQCTNEQKIPSEPIQIPQIEHKESENMDFIPPPPPQPQPSPQETQLIVEKPQQVDSSTQTNNQ
jgi:hypothetical protein